MMPSTTCQNNIQRLEKSLLFLYRLKVLTYSIQHFPRHVLKATRNSPEYRKTADSEISHLKKLINQRDIIIRDLHTEIDKQLEQL
jgi:hypothetical protein